MRSVELGPSPAELKALIVGRARALGAAAVKIARADDDALTRDRLRRAFESGAYEAWPYDDGYAEKASAPTASLPQARSVVCIAIPYATPPPARQSRTAARVSNYAWSDDYHQRMQALLRDLAATIDAAAGAHVTRVACDTAPLAERAFAERAGLGWVGKHTSLIVPGAGSQVFLGEIITTLELEPDTPLRKTCGACTRCITSCPTGALRGDYTMDASRCIADLTQRKDDIPHALRPFVTDWLWGCDLCQEICPPTVIATMKADPRFAPRSQATAFPDVLKVLRLRSGEFRRWFGPTAMSWRGPAVLRRNAAVVLGNLLDRATVGDLLSALADEPSPMVRRHIAWALGRIGSPPALMGLSSHCRNEADPSVVEECRLAKEGRSFEL